MSTESVRSSKPCEWCNVRTNPSGLASDATLVRLRIWERVALICLSGLDRTHMLDMKAICHDVLYENWRTDKLSKSIGGQE